MHRQVIELSADALRSLGDDAHNASQAVADGRGPVALAKRIELPTYFLRGNLGTQHRPPSPLEADDRIDDHHDVKLDLEEGEESDLALNESELLELMVPKDDKVIATAPPPPDNQQSTQDTE